MKISLRVAIPWAITLSLVALRSQALGPTFGPRYVNDLVILYDTGGRCGWVQLTSDGATGIQPYFMADIGGSGDFYIGGDFQTPLLSFERLSVAFALGQDGIPDFASGTPYYVRRYHEDLGCFSTFGYVGGQFGNSWPGIIIPVEFGVYGIPNRVVPSENPNPEVLSISMSNAWVADDLTTMSLGVSGFELFKSMSDQERPHTHVQISFLPGSTQTGTLDWSPNLYLSSLQLHWGPPVPGGPWPDILELGTPTPEGPLRVSFSYDGYTTDTITLDVEKTKAYYWYPVIQSITGPTPTGYWANAGILDQGVADALLGECSPSATLRNAWDPNDDGKTDAADFTFPDQPEE